MKLFSRRRRLSQTTSTQTLPIFGSLSNTSEETISPFTSISEGQMQRNTDGSFIRGDLTQDKGVGVNFDNIGELYTPAASVSTEVDPPPGSPRDSQFEIDRSFTKDVGTSMTDLKPRVRNITTSMSKSTRNSLSRERDTATSIYTPKKDIATCISMSDMASLSPRRDFSFSMSSSPAGRILVPRDVNPFRRDTETSSSFPHESSFSPRKDAGTSFPPNSSLYPRKDAETSFPPNSSLYPRKDAETSFSFPQNSPPSPRKDAEASFSFPQNSSPSPRKDAETSFSFPHNTSLSPRKYDPTWQSQSTPNPSQNDAYKSPSMLSREFSSPSQSLETQRLKEKEEMDAPAQASFSLSETRRFYAHTQTDTETKDTFGQWTHVDPNELAARMALVTWLAQPPATTSPSVSNRSSTSTQTEVEVNLPEVPDLPDNDALCIVGKKIKPPTKSSQRSRCPPIDPKSYPRQLKPKKTTSPYALVTSRDRMRQSKPHRRSMQFEARIPKDHVVLIQNPWGPGSDSNSCYQVLIRPADPNRDSNCITVFTPNPNDNPPMSFSTTYGTDYNNNQGNSL